MLNNQTIWQGFHHITLITRDLDATVAFYRDILDMQIGEILERHERHCFIQLGGTTWGLHFFEVADAEIFADDDLLSNRFIFLPGALQHIALAIATETDAMKLWHKLQDYSVKTTPINQIDTLRNYLFMDNNGIVLEVTWMAK